MHHVQHKHQEPRASEQCAGHTAGCCKPRRVWVCGTPRGPSNVLPVPLPCVVHVLPKANARRQNKTTLDLSNASKNRLKSGLSYATQHAFFNGRVRFPIDCKFCDRLRTNKRKKGKFALRSWRRVRERGRKEGTRSRQGGAVLAVHGAFCWTQHSCAKDGAAGCVKGGCSSSCVP